MNLKEIKARRDSFNEWPINTEHQTWIVNVCKDANQGQEDRISLIKEVEQLRLKLLEVLDIIRNG